MKNPAKTSVIAFAPHPDDAEIFCGGTLASLAAQGHSVGIVDLTAGELASQGSVKDRAAESKRASECLGVAFRTNLELPDGGISPENAEQLATVVAVIRETQAEMLFAPATQGRHPDHTAAGSLLVKAAFFSGLRKFRPDLGPAHTPLHVLHYRLRQEFRPTFVCDITKVQKQKMEAVRCYQSQVQRTADAAAGTAKSPGPLISSPLALKTIETIDRYYGAMIGTEYGEAFYSRSALSISDPLQFFRDNPVTAALNFPGDE